MKVNVALVGYPFLYRGRDMDFHMEMINLGLSRGSAVMCGFKDAVQVICANDYEYWLTDCVDFEEFCKQFHTTPTYTPNEFIKTIKEQKNEDHE